MARESAGKRRTPKRWRARAIAIALLVCLLPAAAPAHIGSPNIFFEGPAGPYPVRVTIQPPGVVPGLAQIHVRVQTGSPDRVTVLPVRWDAGTRGAPPPDVAKSVRGETNLFTAQLWLMSSGAYSVFVDVSGPQGSGTAIVPFNSVAFQRLTMSPGMSALFIGLGLFLVILLISVIGAAVRESALPPGVEPTPARRRIAGLAMGIAMCVAATALFLGNKWWDKVDQHFRNRRLYREQAINATLQTVGQGERQLILRLPTSQRREDSTPLIPDHGHLMHVFLIRQQGDAFAHLHPVRDAAPGGNAFAALLPALPEGEYRVYADITRESGFAHTLTNVLQLGATPTGASRAAGNPDDSVNLASPQAMTTAELPGGFRVVPSVPSSIRATEEVTLRFDILAANGAPAQLQPYLGMYGHLVIQHADGTVFTHLHPLGSISMASQRRFAEREHSGYLASQPLDLLCSPASPILSFPYAFPKPGVYRLWLQTRLQSYVRTVAYTLTVQ